MSTHDADVNSGDSDWEEVVEAHEEVVEELVIFRFPALLGAKNTGIENVRVAVDNLTSSSPQLFMDNWMAFQGTWSAIPQNTALVGLKSSPSTKKTTAAAQQGEEPRRDQAEDDGHGNDTNVALQSRNPQTLAEVQQAAQLQDQAAKQEQERRQKQDAEIESVFAPTLTQRVRALKRSDADDGEDARRVVAVTGLATPSRMITFEPAVKAMTEFERQRRNQPHE